MPAVPRLHVAHHSPCFLRFILIGLVGTQDQAERSFFAGLRVVLFQPAEVEFHLAFVGCLKFAEFQIDGHQAAKVAMIEEQVQIVVFVVDRDSLLTSDECESCTKFQDEGLQFPQDGVFDVLFDVVTAESQEIQKVGSRNTMSGVSRSSSRRAAMYCLIGVSGFSATAVRSKSRWPILCRSVRTLQRSTRHISA